MLFCIFISSTLNCLLPHTQNISAQSLLPTGVPGIGHGHDWVAVIWSTGKGTDLQGRNQELHFEGVIIRMPMNHDSGVVKEGNT